VQGLGKQITKKRTGEESFQKNARSEFFSAVSVDRRDVV